MRLLRSLSVILFAQWLAGCFISEAPLIGPQDAAFPFETITYREPGSPIETTLTHEGDAYLVRSSDSSEIAQMRFRDLGDNLYLAQITGEDRNGKLSTLYGVVRLNRGDMTAATYMAVGRDSLAQEGLRDCGDGILCIDDVDVYLKLAKARIAANEEPDTVYEIVNAK